MLGFSTRKSSLALALACGSALTVIATRSATFAAPPTEAPAGEPGLTQTQLREHGMSGPIDDYGLRINGYVEAGYTFNFNRPPQGNNGFGRLFDDKSDDPKFHQLSLSVVRDVPFSADQFDMGFGAQVIYGADARYTQANGTNFYGSGYANQRNVTPLAVAVSPPAIDEIGFPGQEFPENQIDILQAYLTANLPFGNGMKLTGGKFVTPWGVEKIDPTQNGLYSHSYIFSLATPRTLTGVTATMAINDEWTVTGGIVVGWDQSLEDNNSFPSFMAQGRYQYSDDIVMVFSTIMGPEQEGNRSDYRFTFDTTAVWTVDSHNTAAMEFVVGYEPDAGTGIRFVTGPAGSAFVPAITGEDSLWLGTAIYWTSRVDEYVSLTLRGEYFNDNQGGRLLGTEVYAGSVGLAITPFAHDDIGKNFIVRPEIRYEWATNDIFDGATQNNQVTIGADAIFKF